MSWETEYKKKLRTANEAMRCVQSGMRVYIQPGCAEPETLVDALIQRAPHVQDVEIVHMMTMGKAPYVAPEMAGHFRHNAVFIGGNVRDAVNEGRADYTPVYLERNRRSLRERRDADRRGADRGLPARLARLLQLRRRRRHHPDRRTPGALRGRAGERPDAAHLRRQLHPRQQDRRDRRVFAPAVRNEAHAEITEMQTAIARNVAGLIEDGSVLQTGIGGIPDAVLPLLMDRKDLGVHSELVSDGVIPLIEAGVITGGRKNFKPRKIILGFALGTQEPVRLRRQQPDLRIPSYGLHQRSRADRAQRQHGGDQLGLAGRHHRTGLLRFDRARISTAALAARWTSCAERRAPKAASRSSRCLRQRRTEPSRASCRGSRPGAGVVTSRGLIRYVVTEYGVAYLHGKTIRERAEALIRDRSSQVP